MAEIRTQTHSWKLVDAEIDDSWRQWVFDEGSKDPAGRSVRGYVVVDVRDKTDWDELLSVVGTPVTLEGVFPDGPRHVRLTDERIRDVETIDGRPVTVSVAFGWEAYPDPIERF